MANHGAYEHTREHAGLQAHSVPHFSTLLTPSPTLNSNSGTCLPPASHSSITLPFWPCAFLILSVLVLSQPPFSCSPSRYDLVQSTGCQSTFPPCSGLFPCLSALPLISIIKNFLSTIPWSSHVFTLQTGKLGVLLTTQENALYYIVLVSGPCHLQQQQGKMLASSVVHQSRLSMSRLGSIS